MSLKQELLDSRNECDSLRYELGEANACIIELQEAVLGLKQFFCLL